MHLLIGASDGSVVSAGEVAQAAGVVTKAAVFTNLQGVKR